MLVSMLPGEADAQTYGIGVSGGFPDLGNVASGASGDTVFEVDAATGAVTKLSGAGARISSGTSEVTVTVTCTGHNKCNTNTLSGTVVTTGSPSGRARALTNFDLANGTGTISNESGTNPRTFTLSAIGRDSNKTFRVGMNFPIAGEDSGLPTGDATSDFLLTLDPQSGNTIQVAGSAYARVYRPLTLTKNSDLAFGRVVRPLSGSGVVTISALTGLRSLSGSVVGLATASPSRANYTVGGEGGRTLSISIPPSIVMTGPNGTLTVTTTNTVFGTPNGTLTVTTTNTVFGTPTLSAIMGLPGTYSFSVGGSFTVDSATPSGAYSGTFNVSANYN